MILVLTAVLVIRRFLAERVYYDPSNVKFELNENGSRIIQVARIIIKPGKYFLFLKLKLCCDCIFTSCIEYVTFLFLEYQVPLVYPVTQANVSLHEVQMGDPHLAPISKEQLSRRLGSYQLDLFSPVTISGVHLYYSRPNDPLSRSVFVQFFGHGEWNLFEMFVTNCCFKFHLLD